MKPVSPVLPNSNPHPPERVIGKNQPEHVPLPVLRSESGRVTSRWHLTWGERFRVLLSGDVWIQQLTFKSSLQPIKLMAEEPTLEGCDFVPVPETAGGE